METGNLLFPRHASDRGGRKVGVVLASPELPCKPANAKQGFYTVQGCGESLDRDRRYIRHSNFVDRQVEKNCYIFSFPFDFHFFKWIFMEGKIFRREENTLLRIGVGVFKMRL